MKRYSHVLQAIIELRTGVQTPTPLEWPFTMETNTEQFTKLRLSTSCPSIIFINHTHNGFTGYIRGLRELLVLAL